MKYFISFILLFSFSSYCQNLKLNDLINLCEKKNWSEVNSSISTKGWEYHNSEMGDIESYNVVNWAYGRDYFDRSKAKGWITLYTYDGFPSKIGYQVFNKKSFGIIESSLSSSGFKLLKSEVLNDEVIAEYASMNYMLRISYSKLENEDYYEGPSNAYSIVVTKKGSVYDPNNGLKYSYDDEFNLESEYHLKDGVFHGQMTDYYSDGSTKSISNWSNGKLSGKTINYDKHGNIESEYTLANNMLNGIRKDYVHGNLIRQVNFKDDLEEGIETTYHLNGKVKSTINYSKGKRNGTFLVYDSDGIQITRETYINDILDGPFEMVLFNQDEIPYEIVSGNYSEDFLNGKVVIRSYKNKDTIRIQHYTSGQKSGRWFEYRDSKLAIEYGYKNNELNGSFIEYFTSGENVGKPIKEGIYKEGKKNGVETSYFKLFDLLDDEGKFIGAIYLPVNELTSYSNGFKNGKYRYEEDGVLLEEGDYSKDLKTGLWLESEYGFFWDSTDLLILKGNYYQDKKEGLWKGFIDNKLYVSIMYKDGLLDGPWQFYDKDGLLGTSYEYQNGKRTKFHFYNNNFNYQTITFLKQEGNLMRVEVELNSEKALQRIDYVITDQVKFDDLNFIDYFNEQTKAISEKNKDLNDKKEGKYYFNSADKEIKGQYSKNLMAGEWFSTFKKQEVILIELYKNGNLDSEKFTDLNGVPFSGILTINQGKTQVSIKIKNGQRNGPTIETLDGKEIYKVKYKNGVLKE